MEKFFVPIVAAVIIGAVAAIAIGVYLGLAWHDAQVQADARAEARRQEEAAWLLKLAAQKAEIDDREAARRRDEREAKRWEEARKAAYKKQVEEWSKPLPPLPEVPLNRQ